MTNELEGLEEGSKAGIHIDLLRTTQKKYQMDSGSRHSPPFPTD